jgi:hypothetical protein
VLAWAESGRRAETPTVQTGLTSALLALDIMAACDAAARDEPTPPARGVSVTTLVD